MDASFDERARFLIELARRLHLAGVAASRLEGAVIATARALHIACEIWSAPTGLLLSLGDGDTMTHTQMTRVLRLDPGNVDLGAIATLDRIADRVIAGELGPSEGLAEIEVCDRAATSRERVAGVLAFALASASVAGLLRTGWLDIGVAGALGAIIGGIAVVARNSTHLSAALDLLGALLATVLASAFAHFVAPISVQTVVVAALIVLMPGLALATAATELAAQQLVTGTTRFAAAVMVLLKLTFGSVVGTRIVAAFGWTPIVVAPVLLPGIVEVVATVGGAFAITVLFRTARRDYPLVMASAIFGYVITRVATPWFNAEEGTTFAGAVFVASLAIAALSNLYGRMAKRPGQLIRVPGIMLLVPGSIGFRGLALVMQRDYALGLETGIAVLSALLALTGGLLIGSLLVPPRRYL